MKKNIIFLPLVLFIVLSSACTIPFNLLSSDPTPDIQAIQAAAEQTVVAKLTQDAANNPTAIPATNTPEPSQTVALIATIPPTAVGPTATPLSACDSAEFVTDITIPDGTNFSAGDTFVKTWRIRNVGSCPWNSTYSLVFDTGDSLNGLANIAFPVAVVNPGGYVDLSVQLKAPASGGHYTGYWGIKNNAGAWVPVIGGSNGRSFYVDITVGSAATPVSADFAVTKVTFSVTRVGTCAEGKYVVVANVKANKAGTVNYHWVRSDSASAPNQSVTFGAAGTKQITTEWTTSWSGLWLKLYIDSPNDEQFGTANLNCP